MKTLTETQKAYIAGIIDGEGCVRISKKKNQKSPQCFNFSAFVCITITEIELLCYLKEITGIGCVYRSKTANKENWNPVHRWQITNGQARDLLRAVMPYMMIKRGIAELVLSMPVQRGHSEHKGQQEDLFNRIKQLNVRGVKAVSRFTPIAN